MSDEAVELNSSDGHGQSVYEDVGKKKTSGANGDLSIHEFSYQPTKKQRIVASIVAAVLTIAVLTIVVVLIHTNSGRKSNTNLPIVNMTQAFQQTAPAILDAMDRSVDPCEDFYAYSCNGWRSKNPIPDDKQRWDKSFSTIRDQNVVLLRQVMEDNWPVIGTVFKNCMDTGTINAQYLAPLQSLLSYIDTTLRFPVQKDNIARLIGQLHRTGIPVLFSSAADVDLKDPSLVVLGLYQGGLTLPTLEHYNQTSENAWLIPDYVAYIANILRVAGESDAVGKANRVFEFETDLAKHSLGRTQLRDPTVYYNPTTLDQLDKLTNSAFNWQEYFKSLGVAEAAYQHMVVQSIVFFENLRSLFDSASETKMDTLKYYTKFKLIHSFSEYLSHNISSLTAGFREKLLNVSVSNDRGKWCTDVVSYRLPDIVSRFFVMKTFSETARTQAREMITTIEASFENMIDESDWMDNATKSSAVQKLHLISNKVGYPEHWTDYSEAFLKPNAFLDNIITTIELANAREFAEIGHASDRTQWLMYAFEVNAYYFSLWNEIVFPAGIMQPPFFSEQYPDAINFGGLGSVVGHEISHGFDDKGRQFDGTGNYTQWWSNAAIEAFQQRVSCVKDLYSNFTIEGTQVDGQLTLGENIADAGGVKASHRAFLHSYAAKNTNQRNHEDYLTQKYFNMTAEQLFFVAYGQNWCSNERPTYLAIKAKTDPHSPSIFRTNAPLSNYAEFSRVFQCSETSPMNRKNKCVVW